MEKQSDIIAVLAFVVVLMYSAEQQSMLSESMCMEEDNIILKCVFNRKGDIYFYPTHNEQILGLLVEKLGGFQIDLTNLHKADFFHVIFGDATCDNLRGLSVFVLRFYGPVNPMESCRARSVYLSTRLLGRLSPLSS